MFEINIKYKLTRENAYSGSPLQGRIVLKDIFQMFNNDNFLGAGGVGVGGGKSIIRKEFFTLYLIYFLYL